MTYTSISEKVTQHVMRAIRSSRLVALALVATFASMALQPAQAQSSDTWKSIAIIGGSTAAGAYVGHKVGGRTGALVGAGVGASAGYQIDRRRRANQYYNQDAYGGGYYGNDAGYYGNGGYDGGPYDDGMYPSAYQSNNYYGTSKRFSSRR